MSPDTPNTRWDRLQRGRYAEPGTPPRRREPAFWEQMRTLAERPDFNAFLDWLGDHVEDAAVDPTNPNAGALLRIEGRRSLHRTAEKLSATAERELKANAGPDGNE